MPTFASVAPRSSTSARAWQFGYDGANQTSGSASLTPMCGDFLETLSDPIAHPLER
jgi:hypothetical protein